MQFYELESIQRLDPFQGEFQIRHSKPKSRIVSGKHAINSNGCTAFSVLSFKATMAA
jgi:hypothetical protein